MSNSRSIRSASGATPSTGSATAAWATMSGSESSAITSSLREIEPFQRRAPAPVERRWMAFSMLSSHEPPPGADAHLRAPSHAELREENAHRALIETAAAFGQSLARVSRRSGTGGVPISPPCGPTWMPRSQPRADRSARVVSISTDRKGIPQRDKAKRRFARIAIHEDPPSPADAADPAPEAVNAAPLDRSGLKPECVLMLPTENGYRQGQPLVRNGYSFCQDHS